MGTLCILYYEYRLVTFTSLIDSRSKTIETQQKKKKKKKKKCDTVKFKKCNS